MKKELSEHGEIDPESIPVITEEMEDISLELTEVKVKLNGKPHIIVSADGETATEYRNMALKHVIMRDSQIEGKLHGLAESEPFLVSRCVFLLGPKDERTPYTLDVVKKWNSSAIKKLYNKIREISDLEEKGLEKAKNSPSDTKDGSGSHLS
jgi:hypothetical protein